MLWWTVIVFGSFWLCAVVVVAMRPRWLTFGPRGEVGYTLIWFFSRQFSKIAHRVRYVNFNAVPKTGPLIVVSNHTGGVDPVLISSVQPWHVRWMMAKNTMTPDGNWFWNLVEIIPVARDGRDTAAAREAIRYLREDRGIIGIFPEGGIENPPQEIRPFMDGVGLIVSKSKAPVAVIWVSETRFSESPFGSVTKPSRARVECLGVFDFSDERKPRVIAARLRQMIADASGWPLNDETLPSARRVASR